MPHKVEYKPLATWLQALPLSANCGDLMGRLETFNANDTVYWAGILTEMERIPPESEWLVGLFKLCELLHDDNPRFESGLMLEWTLDLI